MGGNHSTSTKSVLYGSDMDLHIEGQENLPDAVGNIKTCQYFTIVTTVYVSSINISS